MKILFIGGTGTISSACAQLALARGFELTLLNRGRQPAWPGARLIKADISDAAATAAALESEKWDAVVDFIAFTPAELEQRIALFRGRTAQFIFISSASAYQTPPARVPVTESTPLRNPYWQYSRDKIACEELLTAAYRGEGFPATIIRPSHTYDRTLVPFDGGWTVLGRMRRGKPVVVHGDGTSLWTLTHHADFARGWSSLAVLVTFLGGANMLMTGVLGVYVGRIYAEVKRRPLYVVEREAGFAASADETAGRDAAAARRA